MASSSDSSNSGDKNAQISELERQLAQSAHKEFESGNHEGCLQIMSKLAVLRPNDSKVLHNKAVVQYYLSEFRNTDDFRRSLEQTKVNIDTSGALEDVDHCVVYYNHSVILYHLRQYTKAIAILTRVFHYIEPLEDNLARKVCFLLISLYIQTNQPAKALQMISYVESNISRNNDPKGEQELSKDFSKGYESENGETIKMKMQQYKVRCLLMMQSVKACKKEIKSLSTSANLNLENIYLKSELEYLRGNHKKALKLINSAGSNDHSPTMYYNDVAVLHFHMAKYNLAGFYTAKALQDNDSVFRSYPKPDAADPLSGRPIHVLGSNRRYELLYNAGVHLLHAKKPLQAFNCLVEAVQVFHTNPRLWLRLAECCIRILKADNEDDFKTNWGKKKIVDNVVGSGLNRKILLTSTLTSDNKYSSEGQSAAMPMATLEFASLCVKNAWLLINSESSLWDETESLQSVVTQGMSQTNLNLLGNPITTAEAENLSCSVLCASAYIALCTGDNIMSLSYAEQLLAQPKVTGIHKLLGHLYAAEALVMLDKITQALEHLHPSHIKDLQFPQPPSDKAAAKDEAAQADKDKGTTSSNTSEAPAFRDWFPRNTATSRLILQYNICVAHALRGETNKATDLIEKLLDKKVHVECPLPIQAVMLAVYLHIQAGNVEKARTVLKKYRQ